MKITKYEHACLTVEVNGRVLVIDPAGFSDSFVPGNNIDVAVITHEHSDHFSAEKIAVIRTNNPDVSILTTRSVAGTLPGARVPDNNAMINLGNFKLQTFGHDHAPIIDDIVPCDNFGIIVNDTLVYPGDSFVMPPVKPPVLALPVSGPWLKVDEIIKYLDATRPVKVFPIHDALLNKIGRGITYRWLRSACDEANIEFIDLDIGTSLTADI